jgi:hypothetical protein
MKDSLAVGLAKTRRITVDEPRTIDFMGEALGKGQHVGMNAKAATSKETGRRA